MPARTDLLEEALRFYDFLVAEQTSEERQTIEANAGRLRPPRGVAMARQGAPGELRLGRKRVRVIYDEDDSPPTMFALNVGDAPSANLVRHAHERLRRMAPRCPARLTEELNAELSAFDTRVSQATVDYALYLAHHLMSPERDAPLSPGTRVRAYWHPEARWITGSVTRAAAGAEREIEMTREPAAPDGPARRVRLVGEETRYVYSLGGSAPPSPRSARRARRARRR